MAKPKKPTPDKGLKTIADECNEWTELMVNGQYVPRLRHDKKEACESCNAHKGEYHDLMQACELCYICKEVLKYCNCEAFPIPEIACEV